MIVPDTEARLAEVLAEADGPLRIIGGGTRPIGRPVSGETLSTAALHGIVMYKPAALTLVARAGTPVSEIDAVLAKAGQRLPFEPMNHCGLLGTHGEPTIGGVVAANVSGPRRVQVGACRDFLLGVRFVDGCGTVIRSGGRVMKNVTGYDLARLMAGSYGTLGVLSEVSLKVLPQTESTGVLLLEGLADTDAVQAMSMALGSPFEATGAAHTTSGVDGVPVTMIRVEGFKTQVAYRAERLRGLLADFGDWALEKDPDRTRAGWSWVRDVEPFHEKAGDVWRLSVKPSDAPGIAARAEADGLLYDRGGGLVWILVAEGTDLRERLGDFRGHATLVRASESNRTRSKVFHPESARVATLSQGLRERFDPQGILNPGLMG